MLNSSDRRHEGIIWLSIYLMSNKTLPEQSLYKFSQGLRTDRPHGMRTLIYEIKLTAMSISYLQSAKVKVSTSSKHYLQERVWNEFLLLQIKQMSELYFQARSHLVYGSYVQLEM